MSALDQLNYKLFGAFLYILFVGYIQKRFNLYLFKEKFFNFIFRFKVNQLAFLFTLAKMIYFLPLGVN